MRTLAEVTRDVAALGATTSLLYVCTITLTALAATLSRDPERRLDARRALKILLQRHGKDNQG
jgi:hypothetical protein